MGLFDKRDKKKKSDDFDSPVEKIDLSAPDEPVEITADEPPAPAQAAQAAAPSRAAEPEPEPEMDDYDSSFGIDKAIELMRTLPQDNIELVVQVVKLTLESTKVKIGGIIKDAARKQDDIQGRIKVLKEEIADYEKEIALRKEEIGGLEADYEETSTVKQRLELAEKITKQRDAAKGGAPGPAKKVSSDGKDQAKASGSIGGSSARPSVSGLGKQSVVVKK